MLKKIFIFILFISMSNLCFAQTRVHYSIKTSMGDIVLELYPLKAPVTVQNFMRYADHNLYKGSSFFRTCTLLNEADRSIKIEVIQGGDIPEDKLFSSIPIETTKKTSILQKNGVVSMARDTPNSAQRSFFICINDQPELDFGGKRNPDGLGFAAFGKVINGMDVVIKIMAQKEKNQYLIDPVLIYAISREGKEGGNK